MSKQRILQTDLDKKISDVVKGARSQSSSWQVQWESLPPSCDQIQVIH